MVPLLQVPERYPVLLVDDEPDIHAVTKLSLKGLSYAQRKLRFLSAASGKEALEAVRANPDLAVILLDVVMETTTAGLDACKAIRDQLGNRTVRILLRTGQPGHAPERETIEGYDLDGYLPKADLSTDRLYSAVRSALKAWTELVELERVRQAHGAIHECAAGLAAAGGVDGALNSLLETALRICPAPLAVLSLTAGGETRRASVAADAARREERASAVAGRLARTGAVPAGGGPVEGGYGIAFSLPRARGVGWIWLETAQTDALARGILPVLAAHGANALYPILG